ncbi:DUF3488 and transglutaminase-like domain-containing protein [Brachybacterium sp. YJGR34]|uniref:DUF3488 and transglutaminase-like domain-containing protein n=1 Tax=Brachybacterium sp. YJGR34 TaxID=2059911 RepID=UPI000E0B186A|nr:DUF3488 and transglutaminase-like domain-containing protein [Brachybacterium sp. YJGR34]
MSPLMGRPPLEGRHLTGRALLLLVAVVLSSAPASQLLTGSSWLLLTLTAATAVILGGLALRRLVRQQVLVPVLQMGVLLVLVLVLELAEDLIQLEDGPFAALAAQEQIVRVGLEELAGGLAPMTLGPSATAVVVLVIGLMVLLLDVMFLDLGWHTPTALLLISSILLPALQQPAGGPWWNVSAPMLAGAMIFAARTVHSDPRYIQGDRRPQAGPLTAPGRTLGAAVLCVGLVAGLTPGLASTLPQLAPTRIALNIDVLNSWQNPGGSSLGPVMIDDSVSVRRSLLQQEEVEVLRYSTTDQDPSYLRLRTLNTFDGETYSGGAESEQPLLGTTSFSDARTDGQSVAGSAEDLAETTVEITDLAGNRLPVPENIRSVSAPDPALTRAMSVQPTDGEVALTGVPAGLIGQSYTVRTEENPATAEQLRAVDPAAFTTPFDDGYTSRAEVPQPAADLAEELAADAGAETAYDTAIAYQDYFRSSFAYSLTVNSPPGEDPLESFLEDRIGYCEQFASAFALMMTSQGYPTRVAIGFTAGEQDGGDWSVSSTNAHAWPEVWFGPEHGWVRFEPTPAAAANGVSAPDRSEPAPGQEEPAPETEESAPPEEETPAEEEGPTEEPTSSEEAAASDAGGTPVLTQETAQRVEGGLLSALSLGALVAGGGAAAVLLIRRRRLRAREERWAAQAGGGAAPGTDAAARERQRRGAGELAWSEIEGELAIRRTAIRWLGVTGAWGRPPRAIGLDGALPPERALEDLLDQIAAGDREVTAEHHAAAGRIAAAVSAARYAAPVVDGGGVATEEAPGAEDGAETGPVPGEGATPSGAAPTATTQHPLRRDSDLIIHLLRAAR